MQRPAGVTVSATLLIFISFIGILSTIVLTQTFARRHVSWSSAEIIIAAIICLFAIGNLYIACCATGLFRAKNWARIGSILFGIFLGVLSISFLSIVICLWPAPRTRQSSPGIHTGLVILGICALVAAAIAIWLVVYLSSASVKHALVRGYAYGREGLTQGYAGVPLQSPSRLSEITVSRVLVKVYAILCVAWSLFALRLGASGRPYFDLGIGLRGHLAMAAFFFWVVVDCAIAAGLFRINILAYRAALVVQAWSAISLTLWSFPSYRARAHQALATVSSQTRRALSPHAMVYSDTFRIAFSVFYAGLLVVFAWALWSDFMDIRQSKQQVKLDSSSILESQPPL